MKRTYRTIALLLSAILTTSKSLAYKEETHKDISEAAVNSSALKNDPSLLQRLGLQSLAAEQKFPNTKGEKETIKDLFRTGADFEDSGTRARNHFFNPINGEALSIGGIVLGNTSPDWALEDRSELQGGVFGGQEFSYRDARLYFYKALTQPAKAERDKQFGLIFQTLGSVIHHIQDMAQPQHVRNDAHLDKLPVVPLPGAPVFNPLYNPSLYEGYTDAKRRKEELRYTGYFPVYSDEYPHLLTSPRQFWHTETNKPAVGKGLAEFTNRNFVSAGTNFGSDNMFTSPLPERSFPVDIQALMPGTSLRGAVTFYSSTVKDNLLDQTFDNPLATTQSIFDPDLKQAGKKPVYTLNSFNFEAQHAFLIPRAVGYSAGLINYFFRGKIDMVKDKDRIDGYLIKNLGPEAMRGRFALFYDAKDGARKPVPDVAGQALVWKTDDTQSDPLAPQAELRVSAQFNTPADAEKPEEYILVFDGDMGEEKSSSTHVGAVTAKVIRAPNSKLYLAGIDTQGRRMTLKVDGAGVRLVHGFDANNRFVDTGERPPAFDAFKGVADPVGPPPWTKQVVFEPGLRGVQYRVEALSGMGYLFSTDPKTQKWVTKTPNIRGWIARPANEPGIEYEFDIRVEGRALYYRRCAGYGSKVCGSYQYFDWPAELAQGILDHRFGYYPVSGDGTRVCGFPAATGYQGNVNPPGPYYLYQELSVAWDSQDRGQLACLTFHFDRGVLSVGKALLAEFPTSTASGSAAFYDAYPINRSEIAQGTVTNYGGAVIGYIEGKLHHRTSRFQGSYASSLANYTWQAASQRTAMAWTFPEGTMELAGNCGLLASARFSTGAAPFGGVGPGLTGIGPAHALTQRAQDAIYVVHQQGCTAGDPSDLPVTKFRDVVITDGAYVIDSSPNGEIFFARSDLSVIIHEPRAHGVKLIDRASLPANLFKLVGVLWL